MAFGGVATGSMKAKEAETAVGKSVLKGLFWNRGKDALRSMVNYQW